MEIADSFTDRQGNRVSIWMTYHAGHISRVEWATHLTHKVQVGKHAFK